jgi:tetratricopeptide (TPR) repeat protein
LNKKFPKSTRVTILLGMLYESQEKYDDAENLYRDIMELQPNNLVVRRRLVTIAYAKGDTELAIATLCKLVERVPRDAAAWQELVEQYSDVEKFELAKFACEELLMLGPHNYSNHIQYAELLFTLAGRKNSDMYDLARQYFAQAAELKPSNLRALYGICLTFKARPTAMHKRLHLWAQQQILKQYEQHAPDKLAIVKSTV